MLLAYNSVEYFGKFCILHKNYQYGQLQINLQVLTYFDLHKLSCPFNVAQQLEHNCTYLNLQECNPSTEVVAVMNKIALVISWTSQMPDFLADSQ